MVDATFRADDVTTLRTILADVESQKMAFLRMQHISYFERRLAEAELASISNIQIALSVGNTYPQEEPS